MRRFGLFLVIFVLSAGGVSARDIYVSNLAGDDSFSGSGERNFGDGSGPLRTITRALQLAAPGDRIVLANSDEPYRESISLVGSRHSGYPGRPFLIEGNGVILDGSAPVPPDAWQRHRAGVFRFRPPRMGSQQLFINDRPAVRVVAEGPPASPPSLKPLEWCVHRGEIYFCVQPDKLPEDYQLTYAAKQTGITLFHVKNVAIVDLTVQGFRIDGISLYNSARDVYLSGITARGNGRHGVTVGGASGVQIEGCVLGNNGEAQLVTLGYSDTFTHRSELYSNPAPAWVDRGGDVYIDGKRVEGGIDGRDVLPEEATKN